MQWRSESLSPEAVCQVAADPPMNDPARLKLAVRTRGRGRDAMSLLEVTLALALVALVLFSAIVLLSNSLLQTRAIEQEHTVENALAAVREYARRAGSTNIQDGSMLAVVFYSAGAGVGTNWSAPKIPEAAGPTGFPGGIPLTKIVPSPTGTLLQPYVAASQASPYLVYFRGSPLGTQALGTNAASTTAPATVLQALFFRFERPENLILQLSTNLPSRAPDFGATLAVPR